MTSSDARQLAPNVAALLSHRCAQFLPLQWQERPNDAARQKLDAIRDESELLGQTTVQDRSAGAAVRAMLYLWNGWLTECAMAAQAAPVPERLYLAGLCERHLGNYDSARDHLRNVADHPIHASLARHAIEEIESDIRPPLQGFRHIVEMTGLWDPFAFIDVCEQTRAGKACRTSQKIVCRLQCAEFETLFRRCYDQAVGTDRANHNQQQTNAHTPTDQHPQHASQSARPASDRYRHKPRRKTKTDDSPPANLIVMCPKCKRKLTLPQLARGKNARCAGCDATFTVPGPQLSGPAAPPRPPSESIGIRCPKCQTTMMVPKSARGKPVTCCKCAAMFMVPAKQAPVGSNRNR